MKDQPNLYLVSLLYIEEQLQSIYLSLKELEDDTLNKTKHIPNTIRTGIEAIDRQYAKARAIVLPALLDVEPGVVYAFADSQLHHQAIGSKILAIANSFSHRTAPAERATTVAALMHQFNKYSSAVHESLSREEATLLPLLKRYYDEKELTIMKMRARHKQPASATQESACWQ